MKTLIMCAVWMILTSCSKGMEYEPLSIPKQPYFGNQIRIDGFYYQNIGGVIGDIYFFYQDGVLISAGGSFKTILEAENYVIRFYVNNQSYKKDALDWGVFNIEGNHIKFERWYPAQWPYPAYVRAGNIVNDTTFVITESYKMSDGQKTQVSTEDETYHFRQFSQKPDSTNNFVK